MKELIIIGNRFIEFSNNQNIPTDEQFNYLLQMENKSAIPNKYRIYIGQDLNDLQINQILKIIQIFFRQIVLECFKHLKRINHA